MFSQEVAGRVFECGPYGKQFEARGRIASWRKEWNLRGESAEKRRLKKALQGKTRISLSFRLEFPKRRRRGDLHRLWLAGNAAELYPQEAFVGGGWNLEVS